jgi:putative ABC transport system permease protein
MVDWAAYVRGRLTLTGLNPAREAEVVEDVAHQLEDAYREAVMAGLAEPDARRRAERHIADWDALGRELSASPRLRQPAVDRWSARLDDRAVARGRFTFWSRLGADVRYGIRLMLKTPGFSALAIVMLALGTGANAAVFSVVDAVLLRSPFDRPHEIGMLSFTGTDGRRTSAVPREVFDRIASLPQVVAAGSYTISSPVVTNVDEPRRTQVECVPASMATVLGSRPLMGRWFSKEEDTPGGPGVGLVSYAFWQSVLKADPEVIGRRIALDGESLAVIGVMRPGFDGVRSLRNRDIWVPYGQVTATDLRYTCRAPGPTVSALLRVRSGLTLADGTAAAQAAFGGPGRVTFEADFDEASGGLSGMIGALAGAVIAILLIASANVANLSLARLVNRRREIAVRLALGATRARIVRQTVTEQLVLAAAGAAVGVLVAFLALGGIVSLLPPRLPHGDVVSLNWRVLAASIGVTMLFALVIGLIPAIQSSAVGLRRNLSQDDRGGTPVGRRVRWTLVVGELALGLMLLVGALLMIRTFLTLRPSAPGFETAQKSIALVRLPTQTTPDERRLFANAVTRDVLAAPGVGAVATTTYIPMSGSVPLLPVETAGATGEAIASTVSGNYLEVMRIPVLRGRGLRASDDLSALPVAVVNESFVRQWLKDRDPLGALVKIERFGPTEHLIVGVVGDTRFSGSHTRPRPEVMLPYAQEARGNAWFIVSGSPSALAALPATLRQAVTRLRPGQLVDRVERLEGLLADQVAYPRLGAWLFGLFSGLAMLLAAVGLGSTLAWSVTERRREIGVRMALGAPPRAIGRLIVGDTLRLTTIATALGLTSAIFGTRLIEQWIYGVSRTDVSTYAICGAAMLVVALAASYLPTRRATRVDPLTSLRADG